MGIDLERVVRAQQQGCTIGGSTLYAGLLDHVATDVAGGGPCLQVMAPFAAEPMASAVVLRFLAAVHELVLRGEAPDLARHYPSAGGHPGDDLDAAFLATVAAHRDLLTERTAAPIQTNEVGRSASLLGGFLAVAEAGLPLRVLEVGASAGLNLRFDRFRYEAGESGFGPADSPVRFVDPWHGTGPDLTRTLEVADRRGCDARPLDPTDPMDRLRLRACLWPDQPERRARLEGALALAAAVPAPVEQADAAVWTASRLAESAPGVATVLVHSIVAQYLGSAAREAMTEAIAAAGARATSAAPLAWLRMEPASMEEAEIRLTRWPSSAGDAAEVLLGHSGFHGAPIRWR